MAGLTFNVFGHDVSAAKTLKHVEGQADESTKKIGSSFKHLGGVIAGGLAAGGVAEFFHSAFDEATESQKVNAQTAAVIKSTGAAAHVSANQIGQLSTAISNKVGIDDEAIQSGENMLLTFTNIRNEVGKGNDVFNQATQTLTDMSVATGTDMKKSAIQLGKALNDPIKGVTALARVGVTFTAGQKDQIKHLVATGHTMQAQKLILRELNKEFGGSAAAQATPAEKAKVAWKNLEETIGLKLMPVIGKLANFATQTLIPALVKTGTWIKNNRSWLEPLAAVVGGIILAWRAWAIAQAALNLVMDANPILLVITALAALGAGLVIAYKKSETFRAIVKASFHVLQEVWDNIIKPVLGFIRQHWGLVFALLTGGLSLLAQHWRAIWHGMQVIVSSVWHAIDAVIGWFNGGFHGLEHVVHAVATGVSRAWHGIANVMQTVYDDTIGPIVDTIRQAIHDIKVGLDWLSKHTTSHGGKGGGTSFNPFGGLIPGLFGHAQGTGYWRGGPQVMNELGPEIVTLPTGSRIDTASMSASKRRMAGGGAPPVIVNLHVAGSVISAERDVVGLLEGAAHRGVKLAIAGAIR